MQQPLSVTVITMLIGLYRRLISPWLGTRCRFVPTCSDYASEAVQQHGAIKGSTMALKRVCRCHPWGGDGYDPVPLKQRQRGCQPGDQLACQHGSQSQAVKNPVKVNG